MSAETIDTPVTAVEQNEAVIIGDDRLVKTVLKIRARIADVNTEYDAILRGLKEQKKTVEREILRRLQERGATQTKTEHGTCFISEVVQFTIADEEAYGRFVLQQNDYEFYQKRPKQEHVLAWMKDNEGALPPGLSVFREYEINTRVTTKKGTST